MAWITDHTPMATPITEEYELVVAGFWRRIAAFLVDALALWVIGVFIGWVLYYTLISLGPWDLCIGFAVTTAYFAVQDSHLGKGRTLGKRLLHICVVDIHGRYLSVPRATLRCVLFSLPYFLSRWPVPPTIKASMPGSTLLGLALGGIGLSIVYLNVFNYRSRQSLHDLVAGSYVIDTDPYEDATPFLKLWRGHVVAVAILMLIATAEPVVVQHKAASTDLTVIEPLYEVLKNTPHAISAAVNLNRSSVNGGAPTTYLNARLWLDNSKVVDPNLAFAAARFMAEHDANIADVDVMTVTLYCGFDLGIASFWHNNTYSYRPDQFR